MKTENTPVTQRVIMRFRLKDGQGCGTYISQATSIDEAIERLREFYGNRLDNAYERSV
jgi:hypothetical protein